jgi:cytochrome c oxidase assembly protein subunit 15
MYRYLKIYAVFSTFCIFLILIMGTLVTKTGSGEGCGDSWPLCHGQLTPAGTIQSTIEYSHRAVSGIGGLVIVAFAIWAWRVLRGKPDVGWLAFTAVFFIFLQGALGAAAVVWGQSDAVLALHFGFSIISVTSVLLLAIRIFQFEHGDPKLGPPVSKSFTFAIWGLTAYVYLVVYTGAYVSHTGSGMGCVGWPLCNGDLIPTLAGKPGIAFGHRIAALLAFIGISWMAYVAYKHYRQRRDIYLASLLSFILVTLQVISGAATVLSGLNKFVIMLHAIIICLLFGALSFLCIQVYQKTGTDVSP